VSSVSKHYPVIALLALLLTYAVVFAIFILYKKWKEKLEFSEFIRRNNHLSFFSLLFAFSILSTVLSIELIFLTKNIGKNSLVEDFKILNEQVTLINGWNYWFLATVVSSLIFFAFKTILSLYKKKYIDKNESGANEGKIFGASLLGDLIKTLMWPIIITIVTTIDFKTSSPEAIAISLAILWTFVTFVHFHHNISTNSVFGDLFFQEKSETQISLLAKFKYLSFVLLSSAICAIPFAGARLAMPQIFKLLNLNYKLDVGIDLFNKNLDIFTNTDAFLTICIVDCLCLILGFALIDFIAKKLFVGRYDSKKDIEQQAIKRIFPDFDNKSEPLSIMQKDAKHTFDIEELKTRFALFPIQSLKINTQEYPKDKGIFEHILWHKGTQNEVEILKNLRGIFVSPKKQKELETHIKMMSKDIEREISWLKRDSIKNPWFKDGNDLEIKKLKTFYPAVDYLRSQLQIVPQKTKTKSFFIKIGLSIASTVIYHALTQIQTSINKYGHEDPRSIALICVLMFGIFIAGFLVHMHTGKALVGAQSIFREKDKIGDWYENFMKEGNTLFDKAVKKISGGNGCCGNRCGGKEKEDDEYGRNYSKFRAFISKNENIDTKVRSEILKTEKCMCEGCCMPGILKNIINDDGMNIGIRFMALDLLEQATKSNAEKAMSSMKMKGGSCPCSNLAKGDKANEDMIIDAEVSLTLESLSNMKYSMNCFRKALSLS
jgi:hypothetical protein